MTVRFFLPKNIYKGADVADLPHLCGEYDICKPFLFCYYIVSPRHLPIRSQGLDPKNQISQSRMHTAEDVFIRDLPDTQVIGNQSRADREGA